MHLSALFSGQTSDQLGGPRKATPWIASPLDERRLEQQQQHGQAEENKSITPGQAVEYNESQNEMQRIDSHKDDPPFREHRESSTVELFFDLFFVANLATFTSNHEIVDTATLKNYIGFFTLMWFTWLQYSLFDVRFSSDSVFNRTCKAVSFGIFTGFSVCGAIYDTTNVDENSKAFRAMALILMVSRLALVGQYAVILFYVRSYKKTTVPLILTMVALFVGAMVYLGTFFGFPRSVPEESFPIQHAGPQTYIAWYVIACVEAVAVIVISCYWRVVSFRHTHLVERIGLLTLIIMGEGIIGMTKSVSTILQNSAVISPGDIGTIVASVLLIYFIWVLYFDQIEHDRFGTIRQQIWAILHYPLHVAILLTVEGSTALILWNIIKNLIQELADNFPYEYSNDPTYGAQTVDILVDYLNQTIIEFTQNFRNANLSATYNYNADLIELRDIKAPYNSTDWTNEAWDIEARLFYGVFDFIFAQFNIEPPESTIRSNAGLDEASAKINEANGLFNIFNTVFYYIYICAGAFLFTLAVMYYFGKQHKSRNEYISIMVRFIAGVGLTSGLIAGTYLPIAGDFIRSSWLIPVIALSFFVVIVLDNLLVWHSNKTIGHQTSTHPNQIYPSAGGPTKTTSSSGMSSKNGSDHAV